MACAHSVPTIALAGAVSVRAGFAGVPLWVFLRRKGKFFLAGGSLNDLAKLPLVSDIVQAYATPPGEGMRTVDRQVERLGVEVNLLYTPLLQRSAALRGNLW